MRRRGDGDGPQPAPQEDEPSAPLRYAEIPGIDHAPVHGVSKVAEGLQKGFPSRIGPTGFEPGHVLDEQQLGTKPLKERNQREQQRPAPVRPAASMQAAVRLTWRARRYEQKGAVRGPQLLRDLVGIKRAHVALHEPGLREVQPKRLRGIAVDVDTKRDLHACRSQPRARPPTATEEVRDADLGGARPHSQDGYSLHRTIARP